MKIKEALKNVVNWLVSNCRFFCIDLFELDITPSKEAEAVVRDIRREITDGETVFYISTKGESGETTHRLTWVQKTANGIHYQIYIGRWGIPTIFVASDNHQLAKEIACTLEKHRRLGEINPGATIVRVNNPDQFPKR